MRLLPVVGCCPRTDLHCTSVADGETVWALLTGEIDMDTVDHLSHLLDNAATAWPTQLVVDLSGVSFFGACGVHRLTDHFIRCAVAGTRLTLAHPRPVLRNVLEVAGMLDLVL